MNASILLHPRQFAKAVQHLPEAAWQEVAGRVIGGKNTTEAELYGGPITRKELGRSTVAP